MIHVDRRGEIYWGDAYVGQIHCTEEDVNEYKKLADLARKANKWNRTKRRCKIKVIPHGRSYVSKMKTFSVQIKRHAFWSDQISQTQPNKFPTLGAAIAAAQQLQYH